MASSVTYIRQGRILLLGLLVLLVAGFVCTKTSKEKLVYWFQERTNSSNTFTGGTSSSFRCSMGEGTFVRLEFLGGNCLVGSSGRLYRVLPMWARAFLGLGLLLLPKLCGGRGLLYRAVLASLFYCSIRPSFVGILSFCWRLCLSLRPGNPGWVVASHHFLLRRTPSVWCWLPLLQQGSLHQFRKWAWKGFLLLGSWLLSCMPKGRWVALLARRPSHRPAWSWWSRTVFNLSLPFVRLPKGALVTRIGSWCLGLNRSP